MQRLRAQGQTTVYLAVSAVLHEDPLSGAVGLVLVGPGTLSALDHHSVVVDMHETTVNEHVGADINVDSVRGGSATRGILRPDVLRRSVDVAAQVAYMVTPIDMIGPNGRVDKVYVLDGHILTVRHVCQPGTLGILVGTLRIPLAANPELLPVQQAIAVNRPRPADGKAVESVGVDERREELTRLTLETGGHQGVVDDALAASQDSSLTKMQMGALPEKERPRHKGSRRHDNDTTALCGTAVDDSLYLLRLQARPARHHAIVGQHILLA